jgi:hypothetical protein
VHSLGAEPWLGASWGERGYAEGVEEMGEGAGRTAGVFAKAMADPMVEVQRIFLRKVVGASLPPNRQLYAET